MCLFSRLLYKCHTCRQIFGVAKDFCPNFPELARKFLGHFLREYIFMKTVFGMTTKKGFHVILHTLDTIFSN